MAKTTFLSGDPTLAASWSDGIPTINDVAVWDASSGSCTLTSELACSIKVLPSYVGAFSQNGKKITVPTGGVLHLIKTETNTITLDGEIDFSGLEIMCYNVPVRQASIVIRSVCDWWFSSDSTVSNQWHSQFQTPESTLTLKRGTDPYYGLAFSSGFLLTGVRQRWAGTIDFGNLSGTLNFLSDNPNSENLPNIVFADTCRIVSTYLNYWYTPGAIPVVYISPSAKISDKIVFSSRYSSNLIFAPGDYRGRNIELGASASAPSNTYITLLSGDYLFDTIKMYHGILAKQPDTTVKWYGDLIPTPGAGQSVTLPDGIIFSGTTDQEISTLLIANESPLGISADKPAGAVMLYDGDFILSNDFISTLIVSPSFTGIFSQNGKKIIVPPGGMLHLIKTEANTIALNGEIDFHGSEFICYDVPVNQASMTIHSVCDWWWQTPPTAAYRWISQVQTQNSTITLHRGETYPYYNLTFHVNNQLTGVIQYWAGTIDFGSSVGVFNPMSNNPNPDGSANVVFADTCRIISLPSTSNQWYTVNENPTVAISPSAEIGTNARFTSMYNSIMTLVPGDYKGFDIVLGSADSMADSRIKLQSGIYRFDTIRMIHGTITKQPDTVVEWHGDLIPSPGEGQSVVLPDGIVINGRGIQNLIEHDASQFSEMVFRKTEGGVRVVGDVTLCGDSCLPSLQADHFEGTLALAGNQLEIITDSPSLIQIPANRFDFSDSELVIATNDFAADDSVALSALTFTGTTCNVRFHCETDEYAVEHLAVSSGSVICLSFSSSENIANTLRINGDLRLYGTLEIRETGFCKILLPKENGTHVIGNFATCNGTLEMVIQANSTIVPRNISVDGAIKLLWDGDNIEQTLMPGDYVPLDTILVTDDVETLALHTGEYGFRKLILQVGTEKTVTFFSEDDAPTRIHGPVDLQGSGYCQSQVKTLCLVDMICGIGFDFLANTLYLDNLEFQNHGKISGSGTLALSGSGRIIIDKQDRLDVGTLRFYDSDGSVTIPNKGYRKLILESRDKNSIMNLSGEYQACDFEIFSEENLATDICFEEKTMISFSGNFGNPSRIGVVRWNSRGTETLIAVGTSDQTIDLALQENRHFINALVNAKPSGNLEIVGKLLVGSYTDSQGNPLAALDNMLIASNVRTASHLLVKGDRQNRYVQTSGSKIDDGEVGVYGSVVCCARIIDLAEDVPLDPNLIQWVTLQMLEMNPIDPDRHSPRSVVVHERSIALSECFYPDMQQDFHIFDNETFNLRIASDETSDIRFDKPGLYHIIIRIKLFGKAEAMPLRYAVLCRN